jgi:hypothetical protein
MKKLLSILVLCSLLGGNATAEKLFLTCEYENKEWGTIVNFEFDLKNKKYITLSGNKIDIAYTKDEIIFQSYFRESTMFSFEVNRKNGQGSIKDFDYPPILEDSKEGNLLIQMAHSHLRYPDLSDEDKALFSIRDYVRKTFTPKTMSKIDCTKLEKSF